LVERNPERRIGQAAHASPIACNVQQSRPSGV
jgi:hypothetical protein